MRVGPAGVPARESCAAVPESPASPPGDPILPPLPACDTKLTRDETTGAGRTRKTAAAAIDVAANANTRPEAEIRPPPLAELHISVRAHSALAAHAATYRPKLRSI